MTGQIPLSPRREEWLRADTVGVDFGTTTTLVSERSDPAPATVLPIGRTTNWLPSVVRVCDDGLLVGEDADGVSPDRVIRSAKRAITERRDTFTVDGPSGPVEISADDAIAAVLREALGRARSAGVPLAVSSAQAPQASLEVPVRLGCPAMWDGDQRRRLLAIARTAGLPVAEAALVDEPVAAGVAWLAYRFLAHGERPTGRLLVFDMGGGTLDVAVLAVVGGPRPEIAVQSCVGVSMAGDALDVAIANDLAREMAQHQVDIGDHPRPELAWALLERAARETKVRLTHADEHPVVLPRQLDYPHVMRYRRERLEAAFQAQMDGAENLVVSALRAARLAEERATAAQLRALSKTDLASGIDFVLLVGGMSRVPYVSRRLSAMFAGANIVDDAGVPPEEAVVAGLADPAGYERITLHRPGFDFVLDTSFGRAGVYEAYTPLYEPWQVYSGHSSIGYERRLRPPTVPTHGFATLRAVASDGAPLRMRVDGTPVDGLPIRLGPSEMVFGLTCDGRIDIVDGLGEMLALRADGWPVPGREHAGPSLARLA
jgi:molecular chaperone DnaK (HSP70)